MTAYPLRPIGEAACGVTTLNGECSPCSTSFDEGKQKRATQQATVSWSALHPKRPPLRRASGNQTRQGVSELRLGKRNTHASAVVLRGGRRFTPPCLAQTPRRHAGKRGAHLIGARMLRLPAHAGTAGLARLERGGHLRTPSRKKMTAYPLRLIGEAACGVTTPNGECSPCSTSSDEGKQKRAMQQATVSWSALHPKRPPLRRASGSQTRQGVSELRLGKRNTHASAVVLRGGRRFTPPCLAQTPRRHAGKRGAHLIGARMLRLPAHAGTAGLARLERGGHLRTSSRKKMTAYPLRPIGKAACGVTTPNGECSPCSTSSDEGKQKRATQQATVSWSALHPKRPPLRRASGNRTRQGVSELRLGKRNTHASAVVLRGGRRFTPPCLAQTPRRHAEKRGAHLIGARMFRLPAHAGTAGLARLERGGHLRTPSRKKMTAYPLRPIGKAACGVTTPNGECSPCSTSSDEGKQKRATQQATVSWSALHPKRPSSGLCGGFSRECSFQVAIKVPQPITMESDRNRKRRLVGARGTFR